MKKLVIVGAGGFAREVEWLAREINASRPQYEFVGYVVSDLSKLGEHDSRDRVLGDLNWLTENRGRADVLALGIGNPAVRIALGEELEANCPTLEWPALVHPSVHFDRGSCAIGRGVLLCAGTIGTVNLTLEPFCMVNLACTIGHEAHLGKGCVLNPTVNISGGVIVEEGAAISMGVFITQSTPIYNRQTKEITYGRVPAGAVVIPGTLPSADGSYGRHCVVIVKQVDAQTRQKVSLNELLRVE